MISSRSKASGIRISKRYRISCLNRIKKKPGAKNFRLIFLTEAYMALQFILGPSGAGKSEYIYEDIIRRTMQDERENVIVLVPEQYSLEIQRKLVQKHPRGGSFQIDVIGWHIGYLRSCISSRRRCWRISENLCCCERQHRSTKKSCLCMPEVWIRQDLSTRQNR